MKKHFKLMINIFLCTFILSTFSVNALVEPNKVPILSLDFQNRDSLPNTYRNTSELDILKNTNIDTTGLKDLNISGSAQFTALELRQLKNNIRKHSSLPIIDIDLRQESHGFINGNAVSWLVNKDDANAGLTLQQVTEKEKQQLASIPFGKTISLDNGKYTLVPTVVESEEHLVKPDNIKYFRIPVTDGHRPTDDMVDRFIDLVTNLPEKSWLHFHCKAGLGRTTTFMVLYDIMNNAKNVSLQTIIDRQYQLGGEDLFKPGNENTRVIFIKNFYEYAKSNTDGFKTTWSQWIKENNIAPYTLQNEIPK